MSRSAFSSLTIRGWHGWTPPLQRRPGRGTVALADALSLQSAPPAPARTTPILDADKGRPHHASVGPEGCRGFGGRRGAAAHGTGRRCRRRRSRPQHDPRRLSDPSHAGVRLGHAIHGIETSRRLPLGAPSPAAPRPFYATALVRAARGLSDDPEPAGLGRGTRYCRSRRDCRAGWRSSLAIAPCWMRWCLPQRPSAPVSMPARRLLTHGSRPSMPPVMGRRRRRACILAWVVRPTSAIVARSAILTPAPRR